MDKLRTHYANDWLGSGKKLGGGHFPKIIRFVDSNLSFYPRRSVKKQEDEEFGLEKGLKR